MNIVETLEAKHIEELMKDKEIPEFRPGDTVKVNVRIKEGQRERLQAYEGVCICLLYTSPSPRDVEESRMPSSA